jgi:hypothetical protein
VEVREQRSEMKVEMFPKHFVCVLATVGCKHCVPLTANAETKGHRPKNSLLVLWFLISVTVSSAWGFLIYFSLLFIWSPVLNTAYTKPRKEWVMYIPFVVFFLFGDSPASEFYVPTFRNTVPSSLIVWSFTPPMEVEQSVPKRRHIKFRRRGVTQK